MSPPIFLPTPENISRAVALLTEGKPVAFPTETVYGIGADARSDAAIAAVYALKSRPQFNPLICHMLGADMAADYVRWNETARALAKAFWPGPVTLVLRKKGSGIRDMGFGKNTFFPSSRIPNPISLLASAGLDTIAVRSPAHPVARALIAACKFPLAAPSANRSGRVSPTTATHVAEEFGSSVDMILDGGACTVGIESTVVDCTDESNIQILRPGSVTVEEIECVIPRLDRGISGSRSSLVARGPAVALRPSGSLPRDDGFKSPGQLASHYAPTLPVRLNVTQPEPGEALIAFGAEVPSEARKTINLSVAADLKEAAAKLFAALRELDSPEFSGIAVMPIPDEGIGEAINDRLRRASVR